jgi:hypothetical protein
MSELTKKSRIYRYKCSIDKFMTHKSPLVSISSYNKKILDNTYKDLDHLIAICLVTTFHGKSESKNRKFHGYFMACGIDIGMIIVNITNRYYCHKETINYENWCNFIPELIAKMYNCLSQNIDSLKVSLPKEEVIRINQQCIDFMSNGIAKLTHFPKHNSTKFIKKTDFNDYHFKKPSDKVKYSKLKFVSDEILYSHIDDKYGFICKMALLFGWLFGMGDEKKIDEIIELGRHMGIVFKIAYDFEYMQQDLEKCEGYTFNMVINKGIKESYSIYDTHNKSLIEGILKLGIWSNTIKEILDLIEDKVDNGLTCASIDENCNYSEFSGLTK